MLQRELNRLQLRKALLLSQSAAHRHDLEVQIGPLRDFSGQVDRGLFLARQARDLFLAFAPALLPRPKSGLLKTAATLASNWRSLRAVWQGFEAVRRS